MGALVDPCCCHACRYPPRYAAEPEPASYAAGGPACGPTPAGQYDEPYAPPVAHGGFGPGPGRGPPTYGGGGPPAAADGRGGYVAPEQPPPAARGYPDQQPPPGRSYAPESHPGGGGAPGPYAAPRPAAWPAPEPMPARGEPSCWSQRAKTGRRIRDPASKLCLHLDNCLGNWRPL